MEEVYVGRQEFNNLKEEVQDLKKEMNESNKLLSEIDKKIDVITEKISSGDKIDELKLQPLRERIARLEEKHVWVVRTVTGTIIGIVIKLIFDISKLV